MVAVEVISVAVVTAVDEGVHALEARLPTSAFAARQVQTRHTFWRISLP